MRAGPGNNARSGAGHGPGQRADRRGPGLAPPPKPGPGRPAPPSPGPGPGTAAAVRSGQPRGRPRPPSAWRTGERPRFAGSGTKAPTRGGGLGEGVRPRGDALSRLPAPAGAREIAGQPGPAAGAPGVWRPGWGLGRARRRPPASGATRPGSWPGRSRQGPGRAGARASGQLTVWIPCRTSAWCGARSAAGVALALPSNR